MYRLLFTQFGSTITYDLDNGCDKGRQDIINNDDDDNFFSMKLIDLWYYNVVFCNNLNWVSYCRTN